MAWNDFIEGYLAYTEGIPSPYLFRLWAGISLVSSALERRVWLETKGGALFPNQYIVLVASPGIGKDQAIMPARQILASAKSPLTNKQAFHIAPKSVTKASLIDKLEEAKTVFLADGAPVEYHSLSVIVPEFGVLIAAHDVAFLSVLNDIYTNPPNMDESRRTLSKDVDIIFPQLNILAGGQPSFLAELLPEQAWSMGFTARILLIYSGVAPEFDPFFHSLEEEAKQKVRLANQLRGLILQTNSLAGLYGKVELSVEMIDAVRAWNNAKCPPIPDHTRLQHYITRRLLHTLKLSIVAAVSRSGELKVELEDFERAKTWLLDAEKVMPSVFREMTQKSDTQVIQELHYYAWAIWSKKPEPIHVSRLIHFLQTRVPAEKVMRVLEIADRSSIVVRIAGSNDFYKPRPRHEHGLE